MIEQRKVYWNGAYYNALSKDVDVYLTENNL